MSPTPRPLKRARVWSASLLAASTLVVGGIAVHLGEAHAQSTAGKTSGTSTSSSTTSSSTSSTTDTTSGFTAVSPVGGSDRQAQSSSSGS